MRIEFTGRHFNVGDQIREFTTHRLAKVDRFLDEPIDIHVILEVEKRRRIADRRFLAQRRLARGGKRIFRKVEIAELHGEGRDDPRPCLRQRLRQTAQGYSCQTGRTSTAPLPGIGIIRAQRTASSWSFASIR